MLQGQGVDARAIPGGKGQFDIVRDGELVYSKHEPGRFPGGRDRLARRRLAAAGF